jgi:hypothetical protein
MARAVQSYGLVFEKTFLKYPDDLKAFSEASVSSFADKIYPDASKNGLCSSRSRLGQLVRQIHSDRNYINNFFTYPSFHAAFLGHSPETLLADVIHHVAGQGKTENRLMPDYIQNTLIAGLPKPQNLTNIVESASKFIEEQEALRQEIFVGFKQAYPELCKGFALEPGEGSKRSVIPVRRPKSYYSKDELIWHVLGELAAVASDPDHQALFNTNAKSIMYHLSQATLLDQITKDFLE